MNVFTAAQAEKLKEIGNYLRQQRERQSLSLAEVASSTFIHLPVLEALEAGAVDSLPEPVYVRGFIRRYSERLKIDGEALIQKVFSLPEAGSMAAPPDTSYQPAESPVPPTKLVEAAATDSMLLPEEAETHKKILSVSQAPGIRLWAYLLGLAAVVGLGAWYFLARPSAVNTTSKETPALKVEVPLPVTPSPTPASPAPAATAPISATVTMAGDSWLQVKVDGKTEYEGTLVEGQSKRWTAEKQLVLKAGNAGAVNLSVNQTSPKLMGSLGEIKEVVLTPDVNQSEN